MSLSSPFKRRLVLLSTAVLVVDQWTKILVERHLADSPPVVLIPGFLELIYRRNSGIAFGLFAAGSNTAGVIGLTVLGLVALGLVAYYFWRTPETNRWILVALALISGGAVGNLLDRVLSGSVTDFIEVFVGDHHWPTFNAADSAISIGIVMLAIDSLFLERRRTAAGT